MEAVCCRSFVAEASQQSPPTQLLRGLLTPPCALFPPVEGFVKRHCCGQQQVLVNLVIVVHCAARLQITSGLALLALINLAGTHAGSETKFTQTKACPRTRTHTHTHLYLRTQTHPHVHMHKRTHTARGAALTSDSAFRSSELCEPWGAPPAPALPLSLSSSSDTTSTAASARALEQRSKDKTWKGTQGHKDQHCPALRHNILHQPLEPCQTVAAGARRWSTRRRHLSRAPCSNAILRSELGSERWVDPCCCYCCTRAAGLGSGLQVCIAAAAAAADASAQAQLEWKCTAQGLNHSLYEHSVPTAYGACTKGMLEGRRAHNGAHAHLSVSTGLEQHGTAVRMCLKYCIRCQRSLFTASASVERNSSQLQR